MCRIQEIREIEMVNTPRKSTAMAAQWDRTPTPEMLDSTVAVYTADASVIDMEITSQYHRLPVSTETTETGAILMAWA